MGAQALHPDRESLMRWTIIVAVLAAIALAGSPPASDGAQTVDDWITLGTRVHGSFGLIAAQLSCSGAGRSASMLVARFQTSQRGSEPRWRPLRKSRN